MSGDCAIVSAGPRRDRRDLGDVGASMRSLADESFNVVVVEDCCAAATMALHDKELEIINMIYCHVVTLEEALSFFA